MSWSCIENCGACCKFDLEDRIGLESKLSRNDIAKIKSMTDIDGWCKYLDKETKKCKIYESRPHFCRVDKFSKNFNEYFQFGDKFLIDCCKQHISSNYGKKSPQMNNFKTTLST